MTRQDVAYRITKICGRAVSVAVCAMTGMVFMGSAQADTVLLGSSLTSNTTGTYRAGDTFFNANVSLVTNGGYNSNGYFVHNPYSLRQSEYRADQFANIFSSNGDSYHLGTNAVVGAITTGTAAGAESYAFNYNIAESNGDWGGTFVRGSATSQQYFGDVWDRNRNQFVDYMNAGLVGYDDSWDSAGSDWKSNNRYNIDYIGTTFSSSNQGSQSAQNTTGEAIRISGNLLLDGGNVINGTTLASYISVDGNNVNFNGNVTTAGGLVFSSAGSANLNGGADLTGSVNFQGNNASLELSNGSNITGNISTAEGNNSGIVSFEGSSRITGFVGGAGTLKSLQANGTAGTLVQIDGLAKAETLDLHAGVVALAGGIDTRLQDGSLGSINFGNYNGVVQIGGNSISATELFGNVTTDANNTGTLTMVENQQFVTGQIGTAANAIKTLNIGGAGSTGIAGATGTQSAYVTVSGDVFAQGVVFNSNSADSMLAMSSGHNLTSGSGNITTMQDAFGVLNLAGGNQTVTGSIGSQTMRLADVNSGLGTTQFTANVFSQSVSNTGAGTSNFAANVTANTINVNSGISNFTNDVTATITNIGTGVGNFNTNGAGTTVTALVFTADRTQAATPSVLGSATANLITGLTGNIDFSSKDAVVNVSENQSIIGAVTSTGATSKDGKNGVLNFLGGGAISGNIGSNLDTGISELNVNTAGGGAHTVLAGGNIFAESINLKHDATLSLAVDKNIAATTITSFTGSEQAITTDVAHTGTLTLAGGTQTVVGVVGTNAAALGLVNAGVGGATSIFNNMVFADTLAFTGNGTVVLNGQTGLDANTAGIKGTVDFLANGTGELKIGDNVNLTTGTSGIQMTNAGDATLTFNGTSTVTGVVGGNTAGRSTLRTINAGVTGEAVTFKNDVHVSEAAQPTTFHVTGNGTVNFQGNLNGQLVFNSAADGTVNVSNGKSLIVTTVGEPAALSQAGGEGAINFLGGTTLSANLGAVGHQLNAVNFNTASNNVTQEINKSVFADDVTIGGTAGTTAVSKRDVTGAFDYAGATSMFTFAGGTTANLTGNLTLGGNLAIANATTALNVGVAHIATASVTTRGGAMSFTVNSTDITTGGAVSASAGSGQITATGALTMTGAEKVQVNYVGSLANSGTYTLIATGSGAGTANLGDETDGKVSDNSFSIDTSVRQATAADVTALRAARASDLIVLADRTGASGATTYAANQNYIQKAGTVGDFSNNAGIVLGGIAAAGSQTGDMVQVIQKLELDSFGYGNNAANLATQVKRLAPVANASLAQTSYAATGLSMNSVGVRLAALRGDTKIASNDLATGLSAGDAVASSGFWAKAQGSSNTQDQQASYDGYSSKISGVTTGIDKRINTDLVLGAALGMTTADVNQADFRAGDSSRIKNTQVMAYGTYNLTEALYLDGALSLGRNAHTGVRATAVGRTALAAFSGNQLGTRLGLGYGLDLGGNMKFTPMASLDYARLNQDAYTETGAGAISLAVDAQSTSNTRLGLGARLNNEWTEGSTTYRPEVALNWYQNSNTTNNDVTASYIGGGAAFVTPGTSSVSRNTTNLGVSLTVLSSKSSSIQIRYDLDKSTGFTANTGSLLARWEY